MTLSGNGLMQVVLPYFKSKLHAIYNKEREASLQASLWGNVNERFDETDNLGDTNSSFASTSGLDTDLSVRTRFRKRFNKIVAMCYPWLHAGSEGNGIYDIFFSFIILFYNKIIRFITIYIVS